MLKHKLLKSVLWIVLLSIVIVSLYIYVNIKYQNKIARSKLLNLADNIVNDEIVNTNEFNNENNKIIEQEAFCIQELEKDENVIGKLKIPKIEVEAPIKDGTTAEILKLSIGHFSETNYWNGNVCLASHNRGSYAHYFEKINKLSKNDEIIYQTKVGTRLYKVSEIKQISENDLSVLDDTNENTITLITCIANKPNFRLCVKAIEKI